MLIHILRCSVHLIEIAKRDKQICEKIHSAGTEIYSVRVIVTYAVVAFA